MPSLAQIAKRAGVSKSTVSLALNNRGNVTETTRRRVLCAVEDLRRESPPSAESANSTINVLLIHPGTLRSSQVFRQQLQGIYMGIEETKARITLAVNQFPLESNHATHVLLHDRALKPDGVIVMGARRDDPILAEIHDEKLPCVLLAREEAPAWVSTVSMDNFDGARVATEYLIKLGHTRIAFIGGDEVYDYTHLRCQGYCAAMQAAHLSTERLIFLGAGDVAARTLLAANVHATAIVFVNDEYALNAIPVLTQAKLKIPDALSVVSFDDTDEAVRHSPSLTGISVPRTQIGYWATRIVADAIRHPGIKTTRIVLRTHLNERASCKSIHP